VCKSRCICTTRLCAKPRAYNPQNPKYAMYNLSDLPPHLDSNEQYRYSYRYSSGAPSDAVNIINLTGTHPPFVISTPWHPNLVSPTHATPSLPPPPVPHFPPNALHRIHLRRHLPHLRRDARAIHPNDSPALRWGSAVVFRSCQGREHAST
jgi:hypothetical protein